MHFIQKMTICEALDNLWFTISKHKVKMDLILSVIIRFQSFHSTIFYSLDLVFSTVNALLVFLLFHSKLCFPLSPTEKNKLMTYIQHNQSN